MKKAAIFGFALVLGLALVSAPINVFAGDCAKGAKTSASVDKANASYVKAVGSCSADKVYKNTETSTSADTDQPDMIPAVATTGDAMNAKMASDKSCNPATCTATKKCDPSICAANGCSVKDCNSSMCAAKCGTAQDCKSSVCMAMSSSAKSCDPSACPMMSETTDTDDGSR